MIQKTFLVGAVVAGIFGISHLTAACTVMTMNDVVGSLTSEETLEEFGVSEYDSDDVADEVAQVRDKVSVTGRVVVGVVLMLLSAAFLLLSRSPNLEARWKQMQQAAKSPPS